jgi:hypothetical protein
MAFTFFKKVRYVRIGGTVPDICLILFLIGQFFLNLRYFEVTELGWFPSIISACPIANIITVRLYREKKIDIPPSHLRRNA